MAEEVADELLDYEVQEETQEEHTSSEKQKKRNSKRNSVERRAAKRKEFWENVNKSLVFLGSAFNVFLVFFFGTALLGAILQNVQPASNPPSGETEVDEVNWALAREAAIVAAKATYQAIRLWSKLILSILIPTSYKTYLITKEGWFVTTF